MATKPYNLFAYNTSWPLDAHYSQLHRGLSESAAIVAKAIEIYEHYNTTDEKNPKLGFDDYQKLVKFFKPQQDILETLNLELIQLGEQLKSEPDTTNHKEISIKYEEISNQIGKLRKKQTMLNTQRFDSDSDVIFTAKLKDSWTTTKYANYNIDVYEELGWVRMSLADSATNYLKDILSNASFIALVEQTIHVPKSHQAYYSGLTKYDLDTHKNQPFANFTVKTHCMEF